MAMHCWISSLLTHELDAVVRLFLVNVHQDNRESGYIGSNVCNAETHLA